MNKKIMFLMCLLMAMVWTAGCSCPALGPWPRHPPPWWNPPRPRQPRRQLSNPRRGGARSFEEAEETCHLLDPLSDILRVNPG